MMRTPTFCEIHHHSLSRIYRISVVYASWMIAGLNIRCVKPNSSFHVYCEQNI